MMSNSLDMIFFAIFVLHVFKNEFLLLSGISREMELIIMFSCTFEVSEKESKVQINHCW